MLSFNQIFLLIITRVGTGLLTAPTNLMDPKKINGRISNHRTANQNIVLKVILKRLIIIIIFFFLKDGTKIACGKGVNGQVHFNIWAMFGSVFRVVKL